MSIEQKLLNLNDEDVINYVNEILPDWIEDILDSYSTDYDYLNRNWRCICQAGNVSTKKIILVKNINFDNDLISNVGEILTRKGYCVRRTSEFIVCDVCKKALPDYDMWKFLKEKKAPIPKIWNNKCENCK